MPFDDDADTQISGVIRCFDLLFTTMNLSGEISLIALLN